MGGGGGGCTAFATPNGSIGWKLTFAFGAGGGACSEEDFAPGVILNGGMPSGGGGTTGNPIGGNFGSGGTASISSELLPFVAAQECGGGVSSPVLHSGVSGACTAASVV